MTSTPAPPASLGENIRAAREAKKFTQLELGHALGWKGPDAGAQVSRFESGQRQPSLRTLMRIASVLSVTYNTLLAGGGDAIK